MAVNSSIRAEPLQSFCLSVSGRVAPSALPVREDRESLLQGLTKVRRNYYTSPPLNPKTL